MPVILRYCASLAECSITSRPPAVIGEVVVEPVEKFKEEGPLLVGEAGQLPGLQLGADAHHRLLAAVPLRGEGDGGGRLLPSTAERVMRPSASILSSRREMVAGSMSHMAARSFCIQPSWRVRKSIILGCPTERPTSAIMGRNTLFWAWKALSRARLKGYFFINDTSESVLRAMDINISTQTVSRTMVA